MQRHPCKKENEVYSKCEPMDEWARTSEKGVLKVIMKSRTCH